MGFFSCSVKSIMLFIISISYTLNFIKSVNGKVAIMRGRPNLNVFNYIIGPVYIFMYDRA